MKKFYPFLFLLFACSLGAQESVDIPNPTFFFLDTIPCPYDTSQTIIIPKSWTFYQTLNNAWDGPVDSTQCISLSFDGNLRGIDLSGIDLSRALFFRNLFDGGPKPSLTPDRLHTILGNFSLPDDIISIGDTCTNELCTGFFVSLGIPDSTGQGTTRRSYFLNGDFAASPPWGNLDTCIPSEYFSEQTVEEVVFKYSFKTGAQSNKLLALGFVNMLEVEYYTNIDQISFPESSNNGTSYNANIDQLDFGSAQTSFGLAHLLRYQGNEYPSPAHPSFVEAAPETNTATKAILNMTILEEFSLVPQPFTSIRGALVEGSTSERHEFNLIDNGGTICIQFVELIFSGSSHFIYQNGEVELTGKSACMQFKDGARLEVAKGSHLDYGKKGEGALALGKNSTIVLQKNSSIHINNNLVLLEKSSDREEQVYLDLQPGNVLSFGKQAHLFKNSKVEGGQMQLNVLMNGGILDDQELNAAERRLINRIYPSSEANVDAHIVLAQNPVEDVLAFEVFSAEDEILSMALYDLQGKLIWQQSQFARQGFHTFENSMQAAAPGIYLLQINNSKGSFSKKIMKNNP